VTGRAARAISMLLLLAACAPAPDSRGPIDASPATVAQTAAPGEPHFTDKDFITVDGQGLPLRKWLPRFRPRAAVLALHGFNDYSHAFEGPGAAWADRGIATYAYDQRGFGAAPEREHWPGRAILAGDAAAAAAALRRLYPGVPVYLLGESMGGAVAIMALTGENGTPVPEVDGVILAAPAVWGRAMMAFPSRLALWLGVRLLPSLTLTGRGLGIKPSDNLEMLRELARDPMVIKATRVDTIYGLVDLMDAALAAAPRLDPPLLLLYGADDQIIPKPALQRFVDALPAQPRQPRRVAFYGSGYHMLLRDLDRALVIEDIANWVLDPAAPLPSGADRGAVEALMRGAARPAG
jgi:acylglycerol lipase